MLALGLVTEWHDIDRYQTHTDHDQPNDTIKYQPLTKLYSIKNFSIDFTLFQHGVYA